MFKAGGNRTISKTTVYNEWNHRTYSAKHVLQQASRNNVQGTETGSSLVGTDEQDGRVADRWWNCSSNKFYMWNSLDVTLVGAGQAVAPVLRTVLIVSNSTCECEFLESKICIILYLQLVFFPYSVILSLLHNFLRPQVSSSVPN